MDDVSLAVFLQITLKTVRGSQKEVFLEGKLGMGLFEFKSLY